MDNNNTNRISDYFYAESSASSGCSHAAGLSYIGSECYSQCIQNGKRCPIYDGCMQRHNLRQILPY